MSVSRYICLICRNPIPHAGAECPHCKSRSSAAVGATPQMLATVFAVMLALFVATGYYNGAFNRERETRAVEHSGLARTLADYGYYEKAIEEYRNALHYRRGDFDYRLGLARALYYSNRFQEAEVQLAELRAADPTNAVVNHMLAQLAERAGRTQEAVNYYRTAIYGRWPQNPEENRVKTRLELVDLLEHAGASSQVVGELSSLLDEQPGNQELARRAGAALLEVGAAAEAARVLTRVVQAGAADRETYAALGAAQFRLGDFSASHDALNSALSAGGGADILRLRNLTDKVLELDPTVRGISRGERYRRSRGLLQRTRGYIEQCVNPLGESFVGPPTPQSEPVAQVLQAADEALAQEQPEDLDAAIDAHVGQAQALWALRERVCLNVWDEDEPLFELMRARGR